MRKQGPESEEPAAIANEPPLRSPGLTPAAFFSDGVDESVDRHGASELIKCLVQLIRGAPAWLRVVAVSRPHPRVFEALSGCCVELQLSTEPPHPEAARDVFAYAVSCAVQHAAMWQAVVAECAAMDAGGDSSNEKLCKQLAASSRGNFLWATSVLSRVEKLYEGSLEGAVQWLQRALQGKTGNAMRASFQQWFEWQFGKSSRDVGDYQREVRPVLEVLCATYEPLTEKEVLDVLVAELVVSTENAERQRHRGSMYDDLQDARDKYGRAMAELQCYLTHDDGGRVTLYHAELARWLEGTTDAANVGGSDGDGAPTTAPRVAMSYAADKCRTQYRVSMRRGHGTMAHALLSEAVRRHAQPDWRIEFTCISSGECWCVNAWHEAQTAVRCSWS